MTHEFIVCVQVHSMEIGLVVLTLICCVHGNLLNIFLEGGSFS